MIKKPIASVALVLFVGLLACAGPVRAAAPGVTPILNCVVASVLAGTGGGTNIVAYLGYDSTFSAAVTIPEGPANYFFPDTPSRGQPTVFEPGRHDRVFTIAFNATRIPKVSWYLDSSDDGVDNGIAVPVSDDPAQYCGPHIDAVSPSSVSRGQAVKLAVTGSQLADLSGIYLAQGNDTLGLSSVVASGDTIAADLAVPAGAAVGFYDLVITTPDGTTTFADAVEILDGPSAVMALARTLSGTVLAGTAGAGIFISADDGVNWTQSNDGLTDLDVTALAVAGDGSAIYAGTAGDGVFKSTNAGRSWLAAGDGLDVHIHSLIVDPNDPLLLFAGTDAGVYKSVDGGLHWQAANAGMP